LARLTENSCDVGGLGLPAAVGGGGGTASASAPASPNPWFSLALLFEAILINPFS